MGSSKFGVRFSAAQGASTNALPSTRDGQCQIRIRAGDAVKVDNVQVQRPGIPMIPHEFAHGSLRCFATRRAIRGCPLWFQAPPRRSGNPAYRQPCPTRPCGKAAKYRSPCVPAARQSPRTAARKVDSTSPTLPPRPPPRWMDGMLFSSASIIGGTHARDGDRHICKSHDDGRVEALCTVTSMEATAGASARILSAIRWARRLDQGPHEGLR